MSAAERLVPPIKDAFYEARNAGRTMDQAAVDAAARVLATGAVVPVEEVERLRQRVADLEADVIRHGGRPR